MKFDAVSFKIKVQGATHRVTIQSTGAIEVRNIEDYTTLKLSLAQIVEQALTTK